jgi:cbb3-type cytochrome oxidase subunit 3
MRLSDVMSGAGLTFWAEVGLVVSVIAFVALVVYVFLRRNRARFERARYLPLEGDETPGVAAEEPARKPGSERRDD